MTTKKKNWREEFKNNYLEYSDGGVLVKYVGDNDVDIDDFISEVEQQARQEAIQECLDALPEISWTGRHDYEDNDLESIRWANQADMGYNHAIQEATQALTKLKQ